MREKSGVTTDFVSKIRYLTMLLMKEGNALAKSMFWERC
jgi:hypothetical protein